MDAIAVPVKSVEPGVGVFVELEYGAADEIQQGARHQFGRLHLRAGTESADYQDGGSDRQQRHRRPKGDAGFDHTLVMDRPGDFVEPSQALGAFAIEADIGNHPG